jgi:hypothetical protein
MDELARVTGGLMTEATTPECDIAVQTYTHPRTIRKARRVLAQVVPYPVWVHQPLNPSLKETQMPQLTRPTLRLHCFAIVALIAASFVVVRATLPAADDFNRADSASLGANWTADSTLSTAGISGNQMTAYGPDYALSWWSADTFSNDQYAQATITGTGGDTGVAVRVSGDNGYIAYWAGSGSTGLFILRRDAGAYVTLATLASQSLVGQVLRIEATGTTITVKKNGTAVLTATDATYATGSAGIYATTGGTLDDWSGGNVVATARPCYRSLLGVGCD